MRSFALALTAIAVEAYNPWGASPQHSYPSHTTSNHYTPSHTTSHTHAPASTTSHGHVVNPWASSNGYYYGSHGHTHVPAVIPNGWYSATQQYFQKVKYVPSAGKVTVFACCNILPVAGQIVTGLVELAQLPSRVATIKGSLTGLLDSNTYELQIHAKGKTGNITTLSPVVTCDNIGDEYNPYLEATNAFSEPNRGEITPFLADATSPFPFMQTKLTQNLGGANHIIGRSLVIYDTAAPTVPLGCCVIGQDDDPNVTIDPATVTTVNWKFAAASGVHPNHHSHSHAAVVHPSSHSHGSSHYTYAKPVHSNYVGW